MNYVVLLSHSFWPIFFACLLKLFVIQYEVLECSLY
jgi:hypothetical protein